MFVKVNENLDRVKQTRDKLVKDLDFLNERNRTNYYNSQVRDEALKKQIVKQETIKSELPAEIARLGQERANNLRLDEITNILRDGSLSAREKQALLVQIGNIERATNNLDNELANLSGITNDIYNVSGDIRDNIDRNNTQVLAQIDTQTRAVVDGLDKAIKELQRLESSGVVKKEFLDKKADEVITIGKTLIETPKTEKSEKLMKKIIIEPGKKKTEYSTTKKVYDTLTSLIWSRPEEEKVELEKTSKKLDFDEKDTDDEEAFSIEDEETSIEEKEEKRPLNNINNIMQTPIKGERTGIPPNMGLMLSPTNKVLQIQNPKTDKIEKLKISKNDTLKLGGQEYKVPNGFVKFVKLNPEKGKKFDINQYIKQLDITERDLIEYESFLGTLAKHYGIDSDKFTTEQLSRKFISSAPNTKKLNTIKELISKIPKAGDKNFMTPMKPAKVEGNGTGSAGTAPKGRGTGTGINTNLNKSLKSKRVFQGPQDVINELQLSLHQIQAGNNNKQLRERTGALMDFLLKEGIIDKKKHRMLYARFVRRDNRKI